MLRFLIFNILLLVSACQSAMCQQLHFEKRNMEVPSRECYNIFQDSKGFIWFSSYLGLCRYDGKNTFVYNGSNGLPENAVYSVTEDTEGRMWILTSKNRILCIENGKIHEPEFSKEFTQRKELNVVNFALHLKLADGGKEIIINTFYNTFIIDPKSGKIHLFDSDHTYPDHTLELREYHDNLIQTSPSSYVYSRSLSISILNPEKKLYFPDIFVNHNHAPKVSLTVNAKDYYLFSYTNYLFKVSKKDQKIKKIDLPGRIICVYKDAGQGIWVGVIGHGVFYFKDADLDAIPVQSLPEYSVSGVLEDTEGNIWVSTLDKGIFFCRNKSLISYQNLKGVNKSGNFLNAIGTTAYFSSESSGLYAIKKEIPIPVHLPAVIHEAITGIVETDGFLYIGNKTTTIRTNSRFQQVEEITLKNSSPDKKSLFISQRIKKDNNMLLSSINNLVYRLEGIHCHLFITGPTYIRDFIFLSPGQWLLGGKSLFLYNEVSKDSEEIPGISTPISKIIRTTRGTILISTIGEGLFQYKNNKIIPLNRILNIPSLVIFDLAEDSKGYIWLATNQGVIKLNQDDGTHITFGTEDGLISNEIHKLLICDGQLFLSTVEGLCSIPLELFNKSKIAPVLRLSEILISGNSVSNLTLPIHYSTNTLLFRFNILYFSSDNTSLHYLLTKEQESSPPVKTISGDELELQNLPSGTYTLSVTASDKEGIKSIPLSFRFTISKPYWETWWFITIELFSIGLIIYLIIYFIIRRIRKKEKEQTRINQLLADSRLSALQAQMNPHFVFNSINSIQNFILKKDIDHAYDYLTKFSKLIRLVLQNSRKKEISVQEDLEVLRLYIMLEQLRFNNRFEYHERISDDIDPHNTLIPPMLIQPYIENAIWHGIMPLEGKRTGVITLRMDIEQQTIKIVIEDNGVGRKSQEQHSGHESLSMKVTEERLSIVNSLYKDDKPSLQVIDLTDENGTPTGTRIELKIPLEKDDV